jgi:predicted Rossmann fold nucleotide-binding protein DprA/Smf involved in DNA uptake
MKTDQSRIKFNPVTKEIEIEGSEKFVKTYFTKIQKMLLGIQEAVAKAPIKEKPVKKARQLKKAPVVKGKKPTKQSKKRSNVNTVLTLVQKSPEGITTTELKKKTGLTDKQIWAIIANAKKAGKIKQVKRGVYAGA